MSPALRTTLLVLGSALGGIVLFLAAAGAYFYFKFIAVGPSASIETFPGITVVDAPPPIASEKRFYGAHRYTTGTYEHDRNSMLAAGPGKLTGRITADGKPVQGLKLQLALNGTIFSQWGTSGADGRYEISVPYGQYRIDGYGLDHASADAVLAGKVDNPGNVHDSGVFTVAEGRDGKAPDLDFIEPVQKMAPLGEVSATKPVIVSWEPYPGARQYRIQLIELPDRRSPMGQKRLFDWNSQPTTTATSINLSEQGAKLKKGHYYIYEVAALGELDRVLSNSATEWRQPDFQVVD